jgi:hypothetical protein
MVDELNVVSEAILQIFTEEGLTVAGSSSRSISAVIAANPVKLVFV